MRKTRMFSVVLVMALFVLSQWDVKTSEAAKPMVQKNCLNCHQNFGKMENILAGNLAGKSLKAGTAQIKINNINQLVRITPDTAVENIPNIQALKGAPGIRVHYKSVGEDRVATKIVVKPKIKVPEKQLMTVDELAKLVGQGPEKGGYTLVDSRPTPGFLKGHIPTAVSIPFPKMKDLTDKLPEDKDRLLIFYCQGYR